MRLSIALITLKFTDCYTQVGSKPTRLSNSLKPVIYDHSKDLLTGSNIEIIIVKLKDHGAIHSIYSPIVISAY